MYSRAINVSEVFTYFGGIQSDGSDTEGTDARQVPKDDPVTPVTVTCPVVQEQLDLQLGANIGLSDDDIRFLAAGFVVNCVYHIPPFWCDGYRPGIRNGVKYPLAHLHGLKGCGWHDEVHGWVFCPEGRIVCERNVYRVDRDNLESILTGEDE